MNNLGPVESNCGNAGNVVADSSAAGNGDMVRMAASIDTGDLGQASGLDGLFAIEGQFERLTITRL